MKRFQLLFVSSGSHTRGLIAAGTAAPLSLFDEFDSYEEAEKHAVLRCENFKDISSTYYIVDLEKTSTVQWTPPIKGEAKVTRRNF